VVAALKDDDKIIWRRVRKMTKMRTSIILVAVVTAVLRGTLIASAQVSSGSTEAAQQNFAKKSTDKPVQNDQQNAITNRQQEVPKRR
jgi:flagellar basal body-associated protein FliL